MAWECPNCTAMNASGIVCEQCGYRKTVGICLTSAAGQTFTTRISFKIDRKVYKDIGSEYQYLQTTPGSYQFELVRDADSETGWSLQASPGTDLDTLLNGEICPPGQLKPLYSGDVILLGSRRNAGVTAAPLTVSYEGE